MTQLKISIIVSAYTMERYHDLIDLLESISRQKYDYMETIMVVERDRDLEKKLLSCIETNQYKNVKVIFNTGPWGLSAARNLGVKYSCGQIIAFVDDDAVLSPDWSRAVAAAFENPEIIGVTGPIEPLWESPDMNWFPEEAYWIFSCTYENWNEVREVRNGYGTNMAFRKEAFDLCGYFLTSLGAKGGGVEGKNEMGCEETEFSIRARNLTGKKIIYVPLIKLKHKVYLYRFTFKYISKRAFWEGYAKAFFRHHYHIKKEVLKTEFSLLKRILTKIPLLTAQMFIKPAKACKQLTVIGIVLAFVGYGFTLGELQHFIKNN